MWMSILGMKERSDWDFPGCPVGRNLPASAGDMGLMPGLERSHMLQGN